MKFYYWVVEEKYYPYEPTCIKDIEVYQTPEEAFDNKPKAKHGGFSETHYIVEVRTKDE